MEISIRLLFFAAAFKANRTGRYTGDGAQTKE